MIEAILNQPCLIPSNVDDYVTGLFPQLVIYSSAGAVLDTIDATEVGSDGVYHAIYTPTQIGEQSALLIPYDDAGHTIRSTVVNPPPMAKIKVLAVELDQQGVRDAMKLAPSVGTIEAGSVDAALDAIEADTEIIEPLVVANLDAQVSLAASSADVTAAKDELLADHTLIKVDIAAVQAAVDAISTAIASQNDLTSDEVRDAVWNALKSGNALPGSFGEALIAAGGASGLHSVIDGGSGVAKIPHDGNNNAISIRTRIFANEADYLAATFGAAVDEGEVLTLRFFGTDYTLGDTDAVPTTLDHARRGT